MIIELTLVVHFVKVDDLSVPALSDDFPITTNVLATFGTGKASEWEFSGPN